MTGIPAEPEQAEQPILRVLDPARLKAEPLAGRVLRRWRARVTGGTEK